MAKGITKMIKRRLAGAYVSSLVSISLVLLLVGVAALLIVNARSASDYFKERMQVSVILAPGVDDASVQACRNVIDSLPFVKATSVISREQGTKELEELLGEDFLSVFAETPVPVSIDINLLAAYVSADSLAVVKAALEAVPQVEEVESRQSLVEALTANLSRISLVLGVFIVLMLFLSVVLIGNTVRLSLFARRFTIHTMRLVGATRAFIRRPFIRRSVVQGLLASVLACSVLGCALYFAGRGFPQLFAIVRPWMLAAVGGIVAASGILICMVSTYFVVNRLVSAGNDSLYY